MATKYKYQDYEYVDENDELTVEEVRRQLTPHFAEVAAATVKKSKDGDLNVVTFVKKATTKGSDEQH